MANEQQKHSFLDALSSITKLIKNTLTAPKNWLK
jgi:hypothetical protein